MRDCIRDALISKFPAKFRPILPVAGSSLIMITLGFVNTVGNYVPYVVSYMKQQNASIEKQQMLFISIFQGGPPFSFLIGGYVDTFAGPRIAAMVGSVLYSGSIVLSFFTLDASFIALLFTLGVVCGYGYGILFSAAFSVALKWLPQNKGLASGIMMTAAGVSGMFFGPLQAAYVDFPHSNETNRILPPDVASRIPKMFLFSGLGFAVIQVIAIALLSTPDPEEPSKSQENSGGGGDVVSVPLKDMLRSTTFYWLLLSCFGAGMIQVPRAYYKIFGELFIKDDNFLSLVLSVGMGVSVPIRFVVGIIVNKFGYQTVMAVISGLLAITMVTFQFTYTLGKVPFMFWVSIMLSAFGTNMVLFPYATAVFFGSKTVGVNLSFVYLARFSVGVTIGCVTMALSKMDQSIFNILWYITAAGWTGVFALTLTIHRTKYGAKLHNKKVRRGLSVYDVENQYLGSAALEERIQRRRSEFPRASVGQIMLDEFRPQRRNTIAPVVRFSNETIEMRF